MIGLSNVLSWPAIIYVLGGTLFGHIFGLLPGLSGAIGMALILPVTFGMEPAIAFAFLGGIMGAAPFGGSIPAILINTPGAPINAATCFDGFPLAVQGRAKEAIGAAATASCLGSIFGVIVLIFTIPIMRQIVLLLGPPEWFLLALLGLTIISSVSKGSMVNGLIAGCIGLMLSFFGVNPVTGGCRYTFGMLYLWDGIKIVPVLIGLFAIAEMINFSTRHNPTISVSGVLTGGSTMDGIKAVFRHYRTFLFSSVIGLFIGAVPGVGGTVATFTAYSYAKQTSKNPDSFGKGNIEGVIAAEAANDSKDAGALMPLLTLGIPGSVGTAILLGALLLHGLNPGKEMLTTNLPITFTLIWTLVISNILTSAIGIFFAGGLAKLTIIPTRILAPIIFVFCMVGSYSTRYNFNDSLLAVIFGILGYVMLKLHFPRVPIILGLVLGPLAEQSFHLSLQISGTYSIFFVRPISLLLIILIIISIVLPYWYSISNRKRKLLKEGIE